MTEDRGMNGTSKSRKGFGYHVWEAKARLSAMTVWGVTDKWRSSGLPSASFGWAKPRLDEEHKNLFALPNKTSLRERSGSYLQYSHTTPRHVEYKLALKIESCGCLVYKKKELLFAFVKPLMTRCIYPVTLFSQK